MSLKDYYMKLGDDFDEVLGRPRYEQTVQKFIYKFLDDKNSSLLEASVDSKDYTEALRAVHTLKGIRQNLSFTRSFEGSSLAAIALKEDNWNETLDVMPRLSKDYYVIINTIKELKISKEEWCRRVTIKGRILQRVS